MFLFLLILAKKNDKKFLSLHIITQEMKLKNIKYIISHLLVWVFILGVHSQTVDFSQLVFDNHVYHEDILSVKVGVTGHATQEVEMAKAKAIGADNLAFFPPVIRLHTSDKIKVTFDDLSGEIKYMRYTLIHCTYDWKPTNTLNPNEYLNRFTEDDIINYSFSRNTIQPYVSFSFSFPNEHIEISKSGNYLLYIYEEQGSKIIPLVSKRIMVVEDLVTLTADIIQSSNIPERFTHQEINFQINLNNQRFNSPASNIKVLIMQNERYDNALLVTKPYVNQGNILQYNERGGVTIEGGNEFRTFNIKSLRMTMENIEKISYYDDDYYVYIYTDEDRQYKAYANHIDINGYYFNETSDFATVGEADYAHVFFRLKYDKPFQGDIYVFGELTNWQLQENAKLTYKEYARTWQTDLYLKSGYYNYMYLFLPEGSSVATANLIEGSHWETENRYTFYVYYKSDRSSYDRIIGYNSKYSFPKNK